jgi:uncharacterized protein YggU (UPF0235/DUF167 family)
VKKSKPETVAENIAKETKLSSFCGWEGETLILNVLGTPSAKKTVIGKPKGNQLKISVTATPENGKVTDFMVKFLAGEFGVSSKDITVVFGQFNVNKQLGIKSPKKLPPVIAKELA